MYVMTRCVMARCVMARCVMARYVYVSACYVVVHDGNVGTAGGRGNSLQVMTAPGR